MSYEKQTWVTGETITAEKLNHLEGGVEEAQEFVKITMTYDENESPLLDKSYNEIEAVLDSGKIPYIYNEDEDDGLSKSIYYFSHSGDGVITFAGHGAYSEGIPNWGSGLPGFTYVAVASDNTIIMGDCYYVPPIPPESTGKVLSIENGSVCWKSLT